MILDTQARFAVLQAVTASAISQDVIDLGAVTTGGAGTPANAIQDIGIGEVLNLVVNIGTAFSGGAATSMTITLESALDAGLTSSPIVHQSVNFTTAQLTANTQRLVSFVPSAPFQRYVGLRFAPQGGSYAAGTISAYIALDVQANRQYASNFVAA